ncbi:MAG TPA: hypothetical protein VMG12_20710 [Polyangiaceae bacterium]|nr:hypothetical protein [Polyangiaceae bacterium]
MRFDIRASALLACAVTGLSAITGCSGGTDTSAIEAGDGVQRAGALQIPLTATAPSGVVYRLSNAVFEITNPFVFPPVSLEVPADDDTLTVELPPSVFDFDYSVFLRDGWELREVAADGSERVVNATLASFNPTSFTIRAQRTTPLTYQFRASSGVITTGDGAVSIDVAVDDSLIDDFEDGDGDLVAIGGRNGAWFTFNDGTGVQTPAPDTELLPEVVDASANFVLHTTAQGFASQGSLPDGAAFGVGVGAVLAVDPATAVEVPYDASGYSGIGFTFTISFPSSTPIQLAFLLGTSATTPVEEGGTCTEGCYDDFGFVGSVPFSPFTFSGVLPFEALTQGGFGTPATFDPATLLFVKWIVAFPDAGQPVSANRFDLQLDDIAFATDTSTAFVPAPMPTPIPISIPTDGPVPLPSALPAMRSAIGPRVSNGEWPAAASK